MNLHFILRTPDQKYLTFLRVVVAIVMFPHGAQKVLGWFGGHGAQWTIEMWEKWFGFPAFITVLVMMAEFLGPILMIIGAGVRIVASAFALIMIGAVYFVHARWGFFMNWYTEQTRGEGFEYHILMMSVLAVIIVNGAGPFSIDRKMTS